MVIFLKNLLSSRYFSAFLLFILVVMMGLDNYTTKAAADIMAQHGVPFDQIEQNDVVISLVNTYGWTAFHFFKAFIAITITIIVMNLFGWMRIIANLTIIPITSIYCYVVFSNFQQLFDLWELA